MPRNFWDIVNRVIHEADVILLLLDSRLIDETRNPEVESKVRAAKKPLIYVMTKCDLVDKRKLEKVNLKPSVFISAKEYLGTTKLRERIIIEGKKVFKTKHVLKVAVLGYPNVGKSSLINALKGKSSAPVSSISGFTKGLQKIKADNRIMFLDTPGVIPYMEKDSNKHALIGTVDFNRVKNPDLAIMDLMEKCPGVIESHYGVEVSDDFDHTIELIAKKFKLIKKGAEPDIERTSKMILKDWQTGKFSASSGKRNEWRNHNGI
ncbi:MAG: 50S ribosome-binding GTPase [Nanoarchaeota archaeon]|nr:50S ribosome-binding GTPase [Nanoarchaeota archaeon]